MSHTSLFSPLALGAVNLSHRIVQAPLTRLRSEQPGDVPGDLMATHYGQRASKGGLQIAEATTVSVVTRDGWVPVSPHRALKIEEIPGIVDEFRQGAVRAKAAGFDGVEIHGANGYLLDQFLQDGSNKRTDIYGGSIENRARLLLDVTEAVVGVWGEGRVGVRIGPSGSWASMSDSDPEALFGYVVEQMNRFGLAYLHVIEPRIVGAEAPVEGKPAVAAAQIRRLFKGAIIAAGGFLPDAAEEIVARGDADLVAFGRYFSSNPDLPERVRRNLPLTPYDRDTFWGGDHRGYNDFEPSRELADAI